MGVTQAPSNRAIDVGFGIAPQGDLLGSRQSDPERWHGVWRNRRRFPPSEQVPIKEPAQLMPRIHDF